MFLSTRVDHFFLQYSHFVALLILGDFFTFQYFCIFSSFSPQIRKYCNSCPKHSLQCFTYCNRTH